MQIHRAAAALLVLFSFAGGARVVQKRGSSLLQPISTSKPNSRLHPSHYRSTLAPANTEVTGPKHTNKFWGNWVSPASGQPGDTADRKMAIFPAPYSLQWQKVGECESGQLLVSHALSPEFIRGGDGSVELYISHFIPEFKLGAVESLTGQHVVVKEQHFGIHAEVRGRSGRKITYPVYAGMAYVSAQYEGGLKPWVSADALLSVEKVRNGVFRFMNNRNSFFRVYVLDNNGNFVGSEYSFNRQGQLNRALDGWVRIAQEIEPSDADTLDRHAGAILTGWDFRVEAGLIRYDFDISGRAGDQLLHFAYANHMEFLSGGAQVADLTRSSSPVKGLMTPLVGNRWRMSPRISDALDLDFLPAKEPSSQHVQTITAELQTALAHYKANWRQELFLRDHYFSGKGFQKLGMICLLAEKYNGRDHASTQDCAADLGEAFKCLYDPAADGSDREGPDSPCWWAPPGTFYDELWGGLPSRWMDNAPEICGVDFGNYCYNDHHYHFGYFVVSAAILVKLQPQFKENAAFVDFVNNFIRDTSNPSKDDSYFPQFRAFDWFDMHSWSRGLRRNPDGKDQESTSEEVNLHFGVMLWGRAFRNRALEQLGATMLVVASSSIRQYYLMMRNNPNHNPEFAKNHVTGIFFQAKVHRTTWFGPDPKYIHGIQMLPLTPAVPLSRTREFCMEEWEDSLKDLPNNMDDPWSSILFSGNLAFFDSNEAFRLLNSMKKENLDDGLTKVWALYWAAAQ